jgi:hypothetical protein
MDATINHKNLFKMIKITGSLFLFLLLLVEVAYAQAPSMQSSLVTFDNITTVSFTVHFVPGLGAKHAVFIKEGNTGTVSPSDNTTYIPLSSFGLGGQVGTSGWFCVYNNTGIKAPISGLTANTAYIVMVCDYNGNTGAEQYITTVATGNPAFTTTLPLVPPSQSTALTATNITTYTVKLNWVNGTGEKRIVLMKATSSTSGNPAPVNNTYYVPDSKFATIGTEVGSGTGWFCVFNGTPNNTSVLSLLPETDYRVAVIDYNGSQSTEGYSTSFSNNIINFTTIPLVAPTIQTKSISYNNPQTNSLGYTVAKGNGEKRVAFMTEGTSNTLNLADKTTYTASTTLGNDPNVWYCVNNGSFSSGSVTGLLPETTYRMAVFEYNGSAGNELYNHSQTSANVKPVTTGKIAPSSQVSDLTITDVSNSTEVSWTSGNGENTIVFVKQTSSESFIPTDNRYYSPNSGCLYTAKENWQCIYAGSGNSFTLSNLSYETNYCFLAFSYNNGSGAERYNSSISIANQKDYTTPVFADTYTGTLSSAMVLEPLATRIRITLPNDCQSKVIFIKQTSTITDYPTLADGTVYATGNQVGTTGWFCVYNGQNVTFEATGLTKSTPYRVYACYYANSSTPKYNNVHTNNVNGINCTTLDNVLFGNSSDAAGWDPAVIPSAGSNIYVMGGFINSSLTVNNITLANSSLSITGPDGHLTLNGTISPAYGITMSDYSTIIHNTAGITAIYTKYIELSSWNPFSSMMTQAFQNPGTSYMKTYDELTTHDWEYAQSLPLGTGAILWDNDFYNVSISGILNTASVDQAISLTPGNPNSGFNLIGNPFPAYLDWNHGSWDKSNIQNTYWIYKSSIGNYASYNGSSGTNGANQYIQTASSFWIKATASGTLTIPKNARSHSAPGYKSATSEENMIRIKAFANNFQDEAIIGFNEGAALGEDAYDADKLAGALHAPQLFSEIGDARLSINLLPLQMLQTTQYIPLFFTCTRSGNYVIELNKFSFSQNVKITFIDQKEQITKVIEGSSSYSFAYEAADKPNRFILKFEPVNATGIPHFNTENASLYSANNCIYVLNPSAEEGTLELYDASGVKVKIIENIKSGLSNYSMYYTGFYIAVFKTKNFNVTRKIVLTK